MITDYYTAVHWLKSAFILCNEIVENDESVIENIEYPEWTNEGEDGRNGIEIFQWFLTDMSYEDKEWMQKNFPDLIFSYSFWVSYICNHQYHHILKQCLKNYFCVIYQNLI